MAAVFPLKSFTVTLTLAADSGGVSPASVFTSGLVGVVSVAGVFGFSVAATADRLNPISTDAAITLSLNLFSTAI
ncbi:TPA: hypothetical protein ACIVNS_003500 [Salmonella enterica subsp. enterica serovar Birkenhead]